MSRTRKTKTRNPAELFLEWDSEKATLRYYDKENKQNVPIEINEVKFVYLDKLVTITGWSDEHDGGIWSNECRSTKETFHVHAGKALIGEGNYDWVRTVSGAKYTASVYVGMAYNGEPLSLVNLKLKGASLGPWIDFVNKIGLEELQGDTAFQIVNFEDKKKGKNEYKAPVFEVVNSDDINFNEANGLDETLQKHLDAYLQNKNDHVNDDDDLPFED